jgi:hypothetical protein
MQTTHFTPPEFPLLLIVPAIVLDLFWRRTADWNQWMLAAASGALFVAVFAAVQWPFADFLMSPLARNWVFGANYFGYYARPESFYVRHLFYPLERGADFWQECAWILVTATLTTRLGLAAGSWMRLIRR